MVIVAFGGVLYFQMLRKSTCIAVYRHKECFVIYYS